LQGGLIATYYMSGLSIPETNSGTDGCQLPKAAGQFGILLATHNPSSMLNASNI
jgi:hypothetical protein